MADHADEETPQFVTFQPWRIRIAIAVLFPALMMVAAITEVTVGPRTPSRPNAGTTAPAPHQGGTTR